MAVLMLIVKVSSGLPLFEICSVSGDIRYLAQAMQDYSYDPSFYRTGS